MQGFSILLWLSLVMFACGCQNESSQNQRGLGRTTSHPLKDLPKPLPPKRLNTKYAAGGEAAKIYETRCALCHGIQGKGDGIGAQNAPVKPRSFANVEWQRKTPDAHIKKIILEGGQAVGMSALMAGNGDLYDKPKVLADLVKIIRGFEP